MTIEELRWKLREFDDDIEVEVWHPHEERFSEPRFEFDQVDCVCDGHPAKRTRLRIIGRGEGDT